jgi:hypothetical protein
MAAAMMAPIRKASMCFSRTLIASSILQASRQRRGTSFQLFGAIKAVEIGTIRFVGKCNRAIRTAWNHGRRSKPESGASVFQMHFGNAENNLFGFRALSHDQSPLAQKVKRQIEAKSHFKSFKS